MFNARRCRGGGDADCQRRVVIIAEAVQTYLIASVALQTAEGVMGTVDGETRDSSPGGTVVGTELQHRRTAQMVHGHGDGGVGHILHTQARTRAAAHVAVTVEIYVGTIARLIGAVIAVGAVAVEVVRVQICRVDPEAGSRTRRLGRVKDSYHQVRVAIIGKRLLQGDIHPLVVLEGDIAVVHHLGVGRLEDGGEVLTRDSRLVGRINLNAPVAVVGASIVVVEAHGVNAAGHTGQLVGRHDEIGTRIRIVGINGQLVRSTAAAIALELHGVNGAEALGGIAECVASPSGRRVATYRAHAEHITSILRKACDGVAVAVNAGDGGPAVAAGHAIVQFVGVGRNTAPAHGDTTHNVGRLHPHVVGGGADADTLVLVAAHVGGGAIDTAVAIDIGGAVAGNGRTSIDEGRPFVDAEIGQLGTDKDRIVERDISADVVGVDADIARTADGTVEGTVGDALEGIDQIGEGPSQMTVVVIVVVAADDTVDHRGAGAGQVDGIGVAKII